MTRRTKIIATLGPATQTAEMIVTLVTAGVDVFRLNMSHAEHDWCREVARCVRAAAVESARTVALLMDLKGPTIRTGVVEQPLHLKPGDVVEFRLGDDAPREAFSTTVNYPGLHADLKVGDTVLVDNGVLEMKALSLSPQRVVCSVLNEGVMGSRRHINLPGVKVNLPPLGAHDFRDLDLAAELGVDFVAMSFVRDASHLHLLRAEMEARRCRAQLVAKFEDQQALKHRHEIIEATDVVMVARGDLGIEVPFEELPILQRRLVRECIHRGRRVIVATHMLESMVQNPLPTRAEVSDVANAVLEQTDAIMLSGETSSGEHPLRAVQAMDRIARRMEAEIEESAAARLPLENDKQRVVKSAVALADSFDDAALIVFTQRGIMARYASQARPVKAPIFAFCPDPLVVPTLTICRSVIPFQLSFAAGEAEATIAAATDLLRQRRLLRTGQKLVIMSDVLHPSRSIDAILVREA